MRSLNWREIDLILSELDLEGLHVRDITQPDEKGFILELAGRGGGRLVMVRLAPPVPRMHALERIRPASAGGAPPETGAPARRAPRRFAAFLRAHIRGGRIVAAAQIGQERVLRIAVERADGPTVLWIRLWSNAANAVLTDPEGTILDAFYRRPARGEHAGGSFVPPRSEDSRREYAVRDLPGEGSFGARVARFAEAQERAGEAQEFAQRALRALQNRESQLEARRRSLQEKHAESSGFDRIRHHGELILQSLGRATKGDRWLELGDERIELDPALSPSENAQAYFARYKRARTAAGRLERELEAVQVELQRLRSLLAPFEAAPLQGAEGAQAADPEALRAALRELGLAEARPERRAGVPSRGEAPGLSLRSGPFTILVGRNATENDEILRRHARGNDMWFHCRDYPGAYVFVRTLPGKSIPLEVMLDAANLAVHYSRAKPSGAADVYYTAVKYLRRPRKGPLGLVLPTHEKSLRVRLEANRIDRLKARDPGPPPGGALPSAPPMDDTQE